MPTSYTVEQEYALIRAAQEGDRAAAEALVEDNIWLVYLIANDLHKGKSLDLLGDMVQEGAMGLMRAIETFDVRIAVEAGVSDGIRLNGYARKGISGNIHRFLWNNKTIRRPVHHRGRDPEGFARFEDAPLDMVVEARDESDFHKAADVHAIERDVRRAVSSLDPRDQEVLSMMFGIGRPGVKTKAIREKLGVTKQRINQIKARAFSKLSDDVGLQRRIGA